MTEKVIMYLGGGAMMGVFGAGVMSELQKRNVYDQIESIYSGSAGAFNAAYFLAEQTKIGFKIYADHLAKGMLHLKNIPRWLFQRVTHRFKDHNGNTKHVMDIDYVLDLVQNKMKLNVEAIKTKKINWFVKLLNTRTGELEYVNPFQYEPMDVLKAAAALPPYYIGDVRINGSAYVDGAIVESGGLRYFVDKYPDRKIIFVLNNRLRNWKYVLKQFFEGTLASQMYKCKMFRKYLKGISSVLDDKRIFKSHSDRILIISPPEDDPTRSYTRDRVKLRATFNLGKQSVNRIINFIEN